MSVLFMNFTFIWIDIVCCLPKGLGKPEIGIMAISTAFARGVAGSDRGNSVSHNKVYPIKYAHGCDEHEHDDVIKRKHFPRCWPFVRGIHRSPVNSPHKGQWRGALMCSLIWVWINGWVNNREAGDLRRYHAHHDVIVMFVCFEFMWFICPFPSGLFH